MKSVVKLISVWHSDNDQVYNTKQTTDHYYNIKF